jgi:predicted 3-demethylubiquinone-9 3-methyltransferase (glyoxalase superfamily)
MKAPPTISPCLWFDSQAEEAARFYASLFEGSRIGAVTRYGSEGREIHGRTPGSVMTVAFELAGQSFVALNGGPLFTFTPALSLSVVRESAAEVDRLWGALVQGGSVLMELGPYDWSPRYGWLADRYGLSWQISLGSPAQPGQAITPSFLFVGDQYGQGEEAMLRWISLFPDSGIDTLVRVGAGEEPDREGTVRHARFHLGGRAFTLMESGHPHAFSFSEALSLMVPCATQDEVDHY